MKLDTRNAAQHSATLLILRCQVAFAAVAVLAKYLGVSVAPLALTGWVVVLEVGFAFLYCLWRGELGGLRHVHWGWAATRALLLTLALLCNYYGYAHLPLASANALSFMTPLFITVLALLILREQVGWHRRLALLFGFVGMLCIAQPSWGDKSDDYGTLAMLLGAACFALLLITMKQRLRVEAPSTNFLATMLCAGVLAIPLFGREMLAVSYTPGIASAVLLMATMSSLAVICDAEAHQRADASYLAPFSYLQLLWVTLAGLVLWHEIPNLPTCFGAALIVVGGLYTSHRERRLNLDIARQSA